MTKHKKGYKADCKLPYPNRKWKIGQVWSCECGNQFRVYMDYTWGGTYKDWKFIEQVSND